MRREPRACKVDHERRALEICWRSVAVALQTTNAYAKFLTAVAVILNNLELCLVDSGGRLVRAEGPTGPSASPCTHAAQRLRNLARVRSIHYYFNPRRA